MNTALNELRELERQSSVKHAPDVVLDTLEQMKMAAGSSESLNRLPLRRSASNSNDATSTFKPAVAPRMGVQLKPPALRPKPMMTPSKSGTAQDATITSQDSLDKSCTM